MASLSSSYLFDPPSVTSINRSLVNSNAFDPSPSLFGSKVIPNATINPRVLPEPANSIQAANSYIPGLKMTGGSKKRRSKKYLKRINNIANMYKMKGSRKTIRRRVRQLKSRLRSRYIKKSRKNHKRSNRRGMKGGDGYSQFMNNMPSTPNMSTGGPLSPSMSALANPVPYQRMFNTDSLDNLNHFKLNSFGNSGAGSGFPSRGSY